MKESLIIYLICYIVVIVGAYFLTGLGWLEFISLTCGVIIGSIVDFLFLRKERYP